MPAGQINFLKGLVSLAVEKYFQAKIMTDSGVDQQIVNNGWIINRRKKGPESASTSHAAM
jgi:hypothetical protein